MSPSYAESKEKIERVREKLQTHIVRLTGIHSEEKVKYPNPQLRLWSGDIRDFEEFTTGLEEWLSEPQAAEARRLLLELGKWSNSGEKFNLEGIYKDWIFLSDNVGIIDEIHRDIGTILYDGIKKRVSSWVLTRIIEKDLEHASKWAANASQFASNVKHLEDRTVEFRLADEVKKDAVKELLKVVSFDKDTDELVEGYRQFIERADDLVRNRPGQIREKAILNTYKTSKEIDDGLDKVSEELGEIRRLLVDMEWLKESSDFDDYKNLWSKKKSAYRENNLESISRELRSLQLLATVWKNARKRQIHGVVAKVRRMSKSLQEDDTTKEITSIETKISSINWNKPDVGLLLEVSSETDKLLKQLRLKLVGKLQNEDAISIIEDPEIIEDTGERMGWDFERFIKALEVVLRYGLIEIKAVEEV